MPGLQPHNPFKTISQRAVSSYQKLLSDASLAPYEGESTPSGQALLDLHTFFQSFYTRIFDEPTGFGLPVSDDAFIMENEPNEKDRKQEVKRLLDKPRKRIAAGLDFLFKVGLQGKLEGGALRLEGYPTLLKQTGVDKKFFAGLEGLGLNIACSGDQAVVTSSHAASMIPALQALAAHCAEYSDENEGMFLFACCDFRSLGGYPLQASDLYRAFENTDRQRLTELHAYFLDKNYKSELDVHAPFAWNVKYQGDRKIKATPLFQVDYDDRYERPLRLQIKCASTARLAALLPLQSQLLQQDFARRVNNCRGDDCGWCRNQKTLGPAEIVIQGVTRKVCWYTNPDIREFNEDTVELIHQYEQLHAQLAV